MITATDYFDNLIENCLCAKQVKPHPAYETRLSLSLNGDYNFDADSNMKSLLEDLDKLKLAGKSLSFVYIIELVGEGDSRESNEKDRVFIDFSIFRKESDRKCSKINKPSNCLYVGSSVSSISGRLKQHLGSGNRQTYSLHLSHWFRGKLSLTVKGYDVSKDILQLIEDSFWHELVPAFGKSGANNK